MRKAAQHGDLRESSLLLRLRIKPQKLQCATGHLAVAEQVFGLVYKTERAFAERGSQAVVAVDDVADGGLGVDHVQDLMTVWGLPFNRRSWRSGSPYFHRIRQGKP